MKLVHWNEAVDGPPSETVMRAKLEALGYSVTLYHYPPGTVFPPHTHGVDKIDGVLRGRFEMEIENRTVVLEPGDMLVVPRGEVHAARVIGDVTVVSLDAVRYSPDSGR